MPVEFILNVEYSGLPEDGDKQVEKIVGRSCDGSGYGFGGRDMSFYFKTLRGATGASSRLMKAKKSKQVKLPKGLTTSVNRMEY